jgi:hypothetical protein
VSEPIPLTEIAWCAGFWDGEGTCHANRQSTGRRYLQISLYNTYLPALERFQAALGGTIYPRPIQKKNWNRKPGFQLKLDGVAAEAVMTLLRPFLCGEKRAQLDRAMTLVASNPPPKTYADRWATRRARYGPTGFTRKAATELMPCPHGHEVSDRYWYTDPLGRTYQKCSACQRERDAARRQR